MALSLLVTIKNIIVLIFYINFVQITGVPTAWYLPNKNVTLLFLINLLFFIIISISLYLNDYR